jgi:hypothetical protein
VDLSDRSRLISQSSTPANPGYPRHKSSDRRHFPACVVSRAFCTPSNTLSNEALLCGSERGGRMATTRKLLLFAVLSTTAAPLAHGQGFGTVRGTVKDATGSVIPDAVVTLMATASSWKQVNRTDMAGAFIISAVPIGEYKLQVEQPGFAMISEAIQVTMGSAPELQLTMTVSAVTSTVEVTASSTLEATAPDAASPPVMESGEDILKLPGADRMSSLQFVTETTPGAFVLHDHLHIRGGHQVNWSINGVPVPNTNMSSNVGRALDPKDIEEVEINRGGYGAQNGDRTYGQVNVLTRSGFEFNNDADLTLTYGSYNQSNDQIGFGGHTAKFAYYASVSANRTDLGLEPPTEQVIHNLGSGEGFITSMDYKATPADELRWTASVRNDHFQIPNFPAQEAEGYRDTDQELDSFATFSWVHTINSSALLTVSPFYHYNNGDYKGGPTDPLIASSENISNYFGSQVELNYVHGPHNLEVGAYGFFQHNSTSFSLATSTASELVSEVPIGGVGAAFANEQYKPWKWLTLDGGVRVTHFSGSTTENAANPRVGASVQIPKVNWVLRSFYGTYYQAPPLYTVSGALFGFQALESGFEFLPLHGERDIQREFGLTIPVRGWIFDFDHFATSAVNFLDHDVLGNSNILLPLTTPNARINGTEAAVRSPAVAKSLRFHLAFSNMSAEFKGAPSGGLIEPVPAQCLTGYCYLDHDQRNTLTTGVEYQLPWQSWFSTNVVYGSGFLKIDGPAHLPPHITGDIEFGKSIRERWSIGLTALNLSNSRYLLGLDSTFAGTHYNAPREIIASVRYRFHF